MSHSLVGKRLADFKVTGELGRGGMGVVYRATDLRLAREVAIKVLPTEIAHRPELRARLEHEARAVSSLNHPNICTLHQIGHDGDTTFLVMELLEGRSLAERLRQGALPPEEALQIAIQIGSALTAAHAKGLVHRDLKPGNVMLTASGAKLLDFGLAKAAASDASSVGNPAEARTLTAPLTVEGAVLGTLPYMAPEQVSGQQADERTDIFAFGLILYEMLSGERAFRGEDRRRLVGSILHEEPKALGSQVEGLPAGLERLVQRCLTKEPEARWQCAADLTEELRWLGTGGRENGKAEGGKRHLSHRRLASLGAAAAIIAAISLYGGWRLAGLKTKAASAERAELPTRLSIVLPQDAPFLPLGRSALAISPDGRRIVYVGGNIVESQLYTRALDGDHVLPLYGTRNGVSPFFSPDGHRLGFFTNYALRYLPATGGPVQQVHLAPPVTRGACWLSDGDFAVTPSSAGAVCRVALSDQTWRPMTKPDPALGGGHNWPFFFDHERKVLVTVIGPAASSFDEANILAIDLDSGKQRVVVEGGSQARYLASGHLVFLRHGSLFAAPFDSEAMSLTGEPAAVLEHVLSDPSTGAGHLAISRSGNLVFARGGEVQSNLSTLSWIDRSGREETVPIESRPMLTPRISPDGRRVALSVASASNDLWIYDFVRRAFRRLTFNGRNVVPVWTPDGSKLTYASVRGVGFPEIYTLAADGSGHEELVARASDAALFPGGWSPNGRTLAVSRFGGSTGWDVYLATPGKLPTAFAASRFNEAAPTISADGDRIAYCSDESGRWEVYATSFPKSGRTVQVSVDGGTQPVWARDGNRLYFRSGDRLMAAEISAGPNLRASVATEVIHQLPPSTISTVVGAPSYDVAGDGRFLIVRRRSPPRVERLEVVLDWLADLKRHIPTSR